MHNVSLIPWFFSRSLRQNEYPFFLLKIAVRSKKIRLLIVAFNLSRRQRKSGIVVKQQMQQFFVLRAKVYFESREIQSTTPTSTQTSSTTNRIRITRDASQFSEASIDQ
jgi:hypothetical protein